MNDIKANGTLLIIVLFVVIIFSLTYFSENFSTFCQAKDGNYYLVRDLKDKKKAANLLARVNRRIKYFLQHLRKKHYNNRDVARLYRNYNEHQLTEAPPNSEHTSYSVNKGEKIVFCLRHRHDDQKEVLTDVNTMMFVAIHELAHLMSNSIGHTKEFWKNMEWLLKEAIICPRNIYKYVPYHESPVKYCGIVINDTPYKE